MKTVGNKNVYMDTSSPPSRRRGLKIWLSCVRQVHTASPPSRRRGLKIELKTANDNTKNVASFAEAWIEKKAFWIPMQIYCRLLRGGVD